MYSYFLHIEAACHDEVRMVSIVLFELQGGNVRKVIDGVIMFKTGHLVRFSVKP